MRACAAADSSVQKLTAARQLRDMRMTGDRAKPNHRWQMQWSLRSTRVAGRLQIAVGFSSLSPEVRTE
jgi:hypothetical protein